MSLSPTIHTPTHKRRRHARSGQAARTFGIALIVTGLACAEPENARDADAPATGEPARVLGTLVTHLDEMIALAESIRDLAAAQHAAPRMLALVEELRSIEERVELLTDDGVYEANRAAFRAAGSRLRRYRELMHRIAADELMDPELGEAWLLFLTRS